MTIVKRVGKTSSTEPEKIIVDIYCRVSTDPQEDNTSLDEQEAAGRAYCQEHGYIVGMVHRETGTLPHYALQRQRSHRRYSDG